MSTTVTPPAGEQAFDAKAFIDKQNQKDHAARTPATAAAAAAPAEKKDPPATVQPGAGDGEDAGTAHLPRSARREMNQLREDKARLQGILDAYKELGIVKPAAAAPGAAQPEAEKPDPQPARKDYADDAQYYTALGAWAGRQETKKVLSKKDEQAQNEQRFEAFRTQVHAMSEKAKEDVALFPDWDDVRKADAENEDAPKFVPSEHQQLMALLALSDVQAGLKYHFAKEPASLEALLKLTAKPEEQIKSFHRLEGRIDRLYYSDKAAQAGEEKKGEKKGATPREDRSEPEKGKPAGERSAAKLPAPSESASARGGSSPASDVKPFLDNGKLNPAWKAQRNEREGLRR